MVYESDFYTTRRPYSSRVTPSVTSYSVTVSCMVSEAGGRGLAGDMAMAPGLPGLPGLHTVARGSTWMIPGLGVSN